MTEATLKTLLEGITPPDEAARAEAHTHWASLAKPLGGLGALETTLESAAALTGSAALDLSKRAVLVLCADNGVVAYIACGRCRFAAQKALTKGTPGCLRRGEGTSAEV